MARDFTMDHPFNDIAAQADAAAERPSLWRAIESLIRRFEYSDSEIERYIQAHGGTMTDELERDISRKFGYGAAFRH